MPGEPRIIASTTRLRFCCCSFLLQVRYGRRASAWWGLALLLGALGLAGLRTGALPRPLAIAALAATGVNALAPPCSLFHGLHWSCRPVGSLVS